MNIRLLAGEMMLEPTCVMYMKIHIDVEVSVFMVPHIFNLCAGKDS